jgi:hypothetical protein
VAAVVVVVVEEWSWRGRWEDEVEVSMADERVSASVESHKVRFERSCKALQQITHI